MILSCQSEEKQRMDAINDDAKHMEKMAHKRSLLMKKVRLSCCLATASLLNVCLH